MHFSKQLQSTRNIFWLKGKYALTHKKPALDQLQEAYIHSAKDSCSRGFHGQSISFYKKMLKLENSEEKKLNLSCLIAREGVHSAEAYVAQAASMQEQITAMTQVAFSQPQDDSEENPANFPVFTQDEVLEKTKKGRINLLLLAAYSYSHSGLALISLGKKEEGLGNLRTADGIFFDCESFFSNRKYTPVDSALMNPGKELSLLDVISHHNKIRGIILSQSSGA